MAFYCVFRGSTTILPGFKTETVRSTNSVDIFWLEKLTCGDSYMMVLVSECRKGMSLWTTLSLSELLTSEMVIVWVLSTGDWGEQTANHRASLRKETHTWSRLGGNSTDSEAEKHPSQTSCLSPNQANGTKTSSSSIGLVLVKHMLIPQPQY